MLGRCEARSGRACWLRELPARPFWLSTTHSFLRSETRSATASMLQPSSRQLAASSARPMVTTIGARRIAASGAIWNALAAPMRVAMRTDCMVSVVGV